MANRSKKKKKRLLGSRSLALATAVACATAAGASTGVDVADETAHATGAHPAHHHAGEEPPHAHGRARTARTASAPAAATAAAALHHRQLIFGSTPTVPGRHPYMAALLAPGPNRHAYCAGVLVAPDAVLSAAHCVDNNNRLSKVVVGRHARLVPLNEQQEQQQQQQEQQQDEDLEDNEETGTPSTSTSSSIFHLPEDDEEEFEVQQIIHHPYHANGFDYINDHLLHDLVLIKLRGISKHKPIAMNFDETVPAWDGNHNKKLEETNNDGIGIEQDEGSGQYNKYAAGQQLTVVGWGSVNSQRDKPDVLRSAVVNYVPNAICEASTGEINGRMREYAGYITDDMMCAGAPGRDSCGGDSGGPIIIEGGDDNDNVLVGVVSWGYRCADENFPGVYSRLSAHRDWIVRELCSDTSLGPRRYPQWCSSVGEIPTYPPTGVPPTPAPTATPKCLDLHLQFDNFSEEIGWSIQPANVDGSSRSREDGDDADAAGSIITRVPGYYRDMEGQVVKEKVCLNGGGMQAVEKYTFVIVDKRGDGMMSGKQGSYALFDADDGNLLAKGGGNFKLVKMETLDIGLVSDAATDTIEEDAGVDEFLESEDGSAFILVRPEDEEEEDKRKRVDGININSSDRWGAAGHARRPGLP